MVLKYQFPFAYSAYDDSDPYGGYGSPPFRSQRHRGADWNRGVTYGSVIAAVASGSVAHNGWNDALGNVLVIAHPDGFTSGYCHMSDRSPLAVGAAVTRGQAVGTIGNTGSASGGAHLHLTIGSSVDGALGSGQYESDHTDPIRFINDRLNGDDPITTPPQEEEVEMTGTLIKSTSGAGVYWQEKPFAPLYPITVGMFAAYQNQGLKLATLSNGDFSAITGRTGVYALDAQQRRVYAQPSDPAYEGWKVLV
jgi:hypothetical protein